MKQRLLGLALVLLPAAMIFTTGCARPHWRHPVVVQPVPVVVAPTPVTEDKSPRETQPETVVVVIRNPNGSKTPVQLTRVGHNQWKGPRGEVYYQIPSEEQLRPAYGLR
ncbi:MAG: hypothetical protein KKE73_07450 [Proteobacteria bacterium]|nr:hypothetical protein [Pseudomonadota bacterium]